MKKLIATALLVFSISAAGMAEDAFFSIGPLDLNIPLKTVDVVAMYDAINVRPLVGGETPIAQLFGRAKATVGVVTSDDGKGTPFVGAGIYTGNVLDKYVDLGPLTIGGFGGWDFNSDVAIAGIKASYPIW